MNGAVPLVTDVPVGVGQTAATITIVVTAAPSSACGSASG
jgi:hypothetical protein